MKRKKKQSKFRSKPERLSTPKNEAKVQPVFIHPLRPLESLLEFQFQERLNVLLEKVTQKQRPKVYADKPRTQRSSNPSSPKVTRDEVYDILEQAHARLYDLTRVDIMSPALQELENNPLAELDDIADLSQSQLNEEYLKARGFLDDPTSTPEGAKEWEFRHNVTFYKGAFGGQWKEGDLRYDASRIDKDIAEVVFSNYRKLSSIYRALILQYGSENLIEEMYATQVRGEDSFEYGLSVLEGLEHERNEFWDETFSETHKPISGRREYADEDWI